MVKQKQRKQQKKQEKYECECCGTTSDTLEECCGQPMKQKE